MDLFDGIKHTDSGWKVANKQEKMRKFDLFLVEEFVRWVCFLAHTEASGVVVKRHSIIYLARESHSDLFGET